MNDVPVRAESRDYGPISERMVVALEAGRGWISLLAWVDVVFAIFNALAALPRLFDAFGQIEVEKTFGLLGAALANLVVAVALFSLARPLFRSAVAIDGLRRNDEGSMLEALQQQRSYWRRNGVLTLLLLLAGAVGALLFAAP